jgi:hypothetical protein
VSTSQERAEERRQTWTGVLADAALTSEERLAMESNYESLYVFGHSEQPRR